MRQNPFSLYDFLGYFLPGALFLYGLIGVNSAINPNATFASLASELLDFQKIELYLPFTITSYLIGHILSFVSSLTVERFSVWKVGYPSKYLLGLPYPSYFEVAPPKATRTAVRILVALFLLPISLTDLVVGNVFRLRELYAKPLDPFLVEFLRNKIEEFLNTREKLAARKPPKKVKAADVDLFRLVYHYAVEHAPAHSPKMQNYVALYGLLRTLTLILIIFFWIALVLVLTPGVMDPPAPYLPPALFLLAFVAYLDFMKFYRRFSLEALMALSAVFPPPLKPA